MQSNWIGKSSGVEIKFIITAPSNLKEKTINVFYNKT